MKDNDQRRQRQRNIEVAVIGIVILGATAVDIATNAHYATLLALSGMVLFLVRAEQRNKRTLRSMQFDMFDHWAQAQHMQTLLHLIRPTAPLPNARKWAASPDFLSLIASEIIRNRPSMVVEASCGLSTIVIGYLLKAQQESGHEGRCIALEENPAYARDCQKQIELHGLEAFVSVEHAPIVERDGQTWYAPVAQIDGQKIDLLVVDGPSPSKQNPLPRAPAVACLAPNLADDVVILLDDGNRETEKATVRQWCDSSGFRFRSDYIQTEKGTWRLERLQEGGAE